MQLTWEPFTLNLKTTFRIAHGASDSRHNVFVHVRSDDANSPGLEGVGEAAGVPYFGETQERIIAYLESLSSSDCSNRLWDVFLMEDTLDSLPPGSLAARNAIDLAFHDLLGKQLGQPLYRLLGLNPQKSPLTSYTVAIDEPALVAERTRQSNMPIIKIKLGGEEDEATVAAVRQSTQARIRVDANAGWSREQAAGLIPRLAQYDLEFVEQPLAVGDIEGLQWLRSKKLGVPIFADENIKTARDVALHSGAVDGVVIKLMKCSGIRQALRAIHVAHALDMQVMIGCMVESSLGVTAAAHLSPLCEYADLDGPLLISNDPYQGLRYEGARMILPDRPGLGVIPEN
jgi:L-alanine-DL-glutamate epimerase-like enolase superfamily enzyme